MKTPEELQDIYGYLDRVALDHLLLKKASAWYQRWREKQVAREAEGVVEAIPFSTIKLEPVRFAWAQRIPSRMITGMIGDPGLGKSTVLCQLAAQASRGELPGDDAGHPMGVCLCSAEDSPAHILGPRLTAAGADMTRVHLLQFRQGDIARGVRFPDDCGAIRTRMQETSARMLILDPLVAHLASELNSWRDQDIRIALGSMTRLAEELDATVIFLVHLNKNSSSSNPLYRISNSIGIPAAARSILWAAPDPMDEAVNVLLHLKCNVAEKAPTLRYRIEPHLLADGLKTSKIVWIGEDTAMTAEDLMEQPRDNQEHRGALAEAKVWLWGIVGTQGVEAASLLKEAEKAGFSERTIRRAKADLGIEAKFDGKKWVWVQPAKQDGQGALSKKLGSLALNHKKTINTINNIGQGCQAAKEFKMDNVGSLGSLDAAPASPEEPTP